MFLEVEIFSDKVHSCLYCSNENVEEDLDLNSNGNVNYSPIHFKEQTSRLNSVLLDA